MRRNRKLTHGRTWKGHVGKRKNGTWPNKARTREQTRNQNMGEPRKDTWTHWERTHGRTWKGHVGKCNTATWHDQERTRGHTGNGHVGEPKNNTWPNPNVACGQTGKQHMDELENNMWSRPEKTCGLTTRHVSKPHEDTRVDKIMTCGIMLVCHVSVPFATRGA